MKERLGLGMFVGLVLISGLVPTSAISQISPPRDLRTEYVTACINDSDRSNSTRVNGAAIEYSCWSRTAASFYKWLGDTGVSTTQERNRYGLSRVRNWGNISCWHKVEAADGEPTSGFGCSVVMDLGPRRLPEPPPPPEPPSRSSRPKPPPLPERIVPE